VGVSLVLGIIPTRSAGCWKRLCLEREDMSTKSWARSWGGSSKGKSLLEHLERLDGKSWKCRRVAVLTAGIPSGGRKIHLRLQWRGGRAQEKGSSIWLHQHLFRRREAIATDRLADDEKYGRGFLLRAK